MTADEYQYRGYRVVLHRQCKAWSVEIYPPRSSTRELVISYAGAEVERDVLVDDIKQLIDRRLDLTDAPAGGTTAS